MATVVIMPKQGQSVESCVITTFHVKLNDKVSKGDMLFSYETDKASFDEESPVDGMVLEIFYSEGDEVPVLSNVCLIGNAGEKLTKESTNTPAASKQEPITNAQGDKPVQIGDNVNITSVSASGNKFVSPRARVLAAYNGVSLANVKGSGPNGRIIVRDVEALINTVQPDQKQSGATKVDTPSTRGPGGNQQTDAPTPRLTGTGDYHVKQLSSTRRLIAKSMLASLQNSAQLTHHLGADARKLLEIRQIAKSASVRGLNSITINDLVCFATIKALINSPALNAHLNGDEVKYFNKVHLGIAVDTPRGLMVPTLKNANDLSLQGLSNNLRILADNCRDGGINPDLLSSQAASFTISNLGNYGVEMFTPVINLPQVAILGVNTILPRPKDLGNGVFGFVPFIGLSLTYDHRAIDGGEATRFLKLVATTIETLDPSILH